MGDMDGGQLGAANAKTGDEQHSSVNADAKQLEELKQLVTDLSGQVKALQGNKDRGVHKTQKQVDALTNQIAQLTEAQTYLEKFGDPTEAARQQLLDRMIREGQDLSGSGGLGADEAGEANLNSAQAEADKELFELLGVDAAGEDYLKAVDSGLKPLEAAKLVAKANQAAQNVDPNQALGITGGIGSTPAGSNQAQILNQQYEAELEERKAEIQGNPWEVEQIKRKYREKGLEIW